MATTEHGPFRPSARLRILGWMIGLTALAIAGSLLLSRRLLLRQLDAEVNAQLEQEVEEIRALAGGRDPATGQPFGTDVGAIFDTFLHRNLPGDGEAYYTFVAGRSFKATTAPVELLEVPVAGDRWARLTGPAHGELPTDAGEVRWLALPLQDDAGKTLGVFVVANFLRGEREEITGVIATSSVVAGAILAAAVAIGWVVAGRILRPIRQVTVTAQAISDTDLARRIDVEGDDEVAELASTFNAMLDRLEAAFATQRAFVDDAGHELRTPITIVRGHLELLGDDPDERRETVALVTDELDRMSRIVDDLLLLAKLQQPGLLRTETVAVEPFTVELFAKARTFGERRWALESTAAVTVVADPQRLTQAVLNLARNAVEHAGPGAAVTLGSAASNGDVRFWVADTGTGIPEDDRSVIFERFARGGDRRRRSEGAGLGLSIVRAVAEAHAGTVELASPPGGGSRFTLTIPADPPGGRPVTRILIAEDEPRIASFLDKGLRADGFSTTIVADGLIAAALARDEDFDLMILDLGLPRLHGLEVLRELRARGERLPVVILTARDEVDVTVAGFAGGADDYVTKPFRFEELMARIRVRLRREATRELTLLRCGVVTLDLRTRRAAVGERTVELTAREFALAETFLRHPDQVLSRQQLLSHVWGYDFDPESNIVDVYVRYLRRKLGPGVIETVRGMGYRVVTGAAG